MRSKMSRSRKNSCDCRNKTKGNPKVGDGICRFHINWGDYRKAVMDRIAGKKYCRQWDAEYQEDEPV